MPTGSFLPMLVVMTGVVLMLVLGLVFVVVLALVLAFVLMFMGSLVLVFVFMFVLVLVSMIVLMVMGMIVPVVMIVAVVMIMMMVIMRVAHGVGLRIGLEHCFDPREGAAELGELLLRFVIGCDAERAVADLRQDMFAAQEERRSRKRGPIAEAGLHDRLRGGFDLDHPAIGGHTQIAAMQYASLAQVHLHVFTGFELAGHLAVRAKCQRTAQSSADLEVVGSAFDFELGADFEHGRVDVDGWENQRS